MGLFHHFLDCFNDSSWSAVKLAIKIFSANQDIVLPVTAVKKWQWKHLIKLAEEMRLNHRKCYYGALLRYYTNSTEDSNLDPFRIAAFLMSVLRRVLPAEAKKSTHFMNHVKRSKPPA